MKYTEWQMLTESFGPRALGLTGRQVLGGPVGSRLQEAPLDFTDDEEEEDEELEDEEGEEGEEDLLGDEPEGPEKGFPPDDSEDMDGLPTPDEEMIGDDEMGDMGDMGDIDPALAGLGDDDMAMGDAGEEPSMDDMLGMGDEIGGMGEEMPMDMGDEMGEEMPMDMGDEMGEEMPMDMGDEMGAAEIPCPDCNMDGEMEEGDPDCVACGGAGFVTDDQAEMPESPEDVDAEVVEDDPEGEMMELMARMQDYCKRFMPQYAQKYSRKYMDKDSCSCCKKTTDKCNCNKTCCKEDNEFLNRLAKASGIKREDALITPAEPTEEQPEAGQVGFAPQGRVGSIGGGYTMSDFDDIPTLGESHNYSTWQQFRAKKD